MRHRSVLQLAPQGVTVHPEPLATTAEIAALRKAATAFVKPPAGEVSDARTGFFWCDVSPDGVFEPGSRLTLEELADLSEEVRGAKR